MFYHCLSNIPAVILQLNLDVFATAIGMIPICLYNVEVIDIMNNPLLATTSPSDFWGKRWNLLIHGVLKVQYFTDFFHLFDSS